MQVKTGEAAQKAIVKGVNAVYDPVRLTIGPAGGNALMYRTFGRGPRITNDGVTIAGAIEPKDPFVKLVAEAFFEACSKTNEIAGDGTTTTSVVGGHLLNKIYENINANAGSFVKRDNVNVMAIRNQMIEASVAVIEAVKKQAKPVKTIEELEKIATVSVEDKELGKLIASMAWEVGVDGYIDVVEGFKGEIEHEVIKGMRFPAKVPNKVFVNNQARYEMVMQDVPVLLTNYNLDNAVEVGELIGRLFKEGNIKKLAILAPSFSDSVLGNLFNSQRIVNPDGTVSPSGYMFYPVKVPSLRSEQFEDVAAYTGATFINKDKDMKLSTVSAVDLGFLGRLVVKDMEAREDAIATGGKGEKTAVKERIEELKKQKAETKMQNHKALLDRRIASMSSAVGIIRVGAPSQAEGLYLKLKVEDAVYATKAALEEGYVAGGGLCLKEIAETLPQSILTESLKAPYNQIQENAGGNLKIGKDIIDPAKVVRLVVEHAVSVASHLATVQILIPETKDESPADGYNAIARAILKASGQDKKGNGAGEDDWDGEIEEAMRDNG